MKKITIILVWALLCLNFCSNAQVTSVAKFLQVGDVMPDYPILNIRNSKIKSAKISEYKGKLILLDFWGTACSACIDAFPELDSLQHEFSGKIQILLVNPKKVNDTERRIKIVLNRVNTWSERPLTLPIVFRDSLISENFEFHSIPHIIWVDPSGKIMAITDKSEVSRQNIAKILSNEPVHLLPKRHD